MICLSQFEPATDQRLARLGKGFRPPKREDIVERAEDFAAFYRRSLDPCLRAVLAVDGNLSTAEELVAEGFARAYARWSQVSRHPSPEAWVVRTALNLRVSRWRKRRREALVQQPPERAQAPNQSGPPDLELVKMLGQLPRRQREVVAYRLLLDLDVAATAHTLGIAESTVSVHLHRALATLRRELCAEGTYS